MKIQRKRLNGFHPVLVGLSGALLGLGLSSVALAGGTLLASRGTNGGSFCAAATQGNPCSRVGAMHYGSVDHSGDLRLWDKPLGYEPAYGPSWQFSIGLDPNDVTSTVSAVNAGGWSVSVAGYVTTVPLLDAMGHPLSDGVAKVVGVDGGYEEYVSTAGMGCSASTTMRCEYPQEGLSKNALIRWGGDASAWNASATHGAVPMNVQALASTPQSFVRVSPNGGYEVYGGTADAIRNVPNGQELWLSAVVDRMGLVLRFRYETVGGILRVTDVGDATIESMSPPVRNAAGSIVSGSSLGWVHFYYPDTDPRYQAAGLHDWTLNQLGVSNPGVFSLVTGVEDPYGHQAQLEYRDLITGLRIGEAPSADAALLSALRERSQQFRLITSRDVVGVESTVNYQCGATTLAGYPGELDSRRAVAVSNGCLNGSGTGLGPNGLMVSSTQTPYGVTKYQRVSIDNGPTHRRGWVVTNAAGMSERWEAVFGSLSQEVQSQLMGLMGNRPERPSHIPAGAWEMLGSISSQYRTSLHWTYKAMGDLLNPTDVNVIPALDHAQIKQYLHDYPARTGGQPTTSPVLTVSKEPLEGWVYYAYPGVASADTYRNSSMTGETSALATPMVVARRLDDGTTQATYVSYNAKGNPQVRVDALGRATETVYAANGIDATDVYQVRWNASAVTSPGYGNGGVTRLERLSHQEVNGRGQVTRSEGTTAVDGITYDYEAVSPYRLSGITTSEGHASLSWSVPYWPGTSLQVKRLTLVGADGLVSTSDYQQGHLIETRSAGRRSNWGDFDAFGRPWNASVDGELKVWYQYRGLDLVSIRNVINGSEVRIEPDYLGRPALTQQLDRAGNLMQQWYRSYDASGGVSTLWSGLVWGEYVGWNYDVAGRVQKRLDSDGSSQEMSYERSLSRVHGVRDARGIWTYLTYDAANELIEKRLRTETAAPTISLQYDNTYNRLNHRTDPIGVTSYHYDRDQPYRLSSIDEPLPMTGSTTTTLNYDPQNRNTGWTLSERGVTQSQLTLSLDDTHQGRVSRITTELGIAVPGYDGMDNATQYGELNQINIDLRPELHLPQATAIQSIGRAGVSEHRRVNRITYQNPATGAVLASTGMSYDGLGRIRHVEGLTHDRSRDYRYDERSELKRASEWQSGAGGLTHVQTQGYAYDEAGNRKDVNNQAAPNLDGSDGAVLENLSHAQYTASNRIGSVTQAGMTKASDHDAAGNLTINPVKNQSYVWDDENRLVRIDYTGKGKPGQTKGQGSTLFTYDGAGQIRRIQELDGMGATTEDWSYVWVGGQLVQKRETATNRVVQSCNTDICADHNMDGTITKYLLLKDYLGSVIGKTDVNGNVLERIDYTPWGEVENRQVRDSTGTLQDTTDRTPSTPTTYAGYVFHARSGLSLTRFRQYDAALGRWLSKDPIGELGGVNLYGYVGNNAVNLTDSSGLLPRDPLRCIETALRVPLAIYDIYDATAWEAFARQVPPGGRVPPVEGSMARLMSERPARAQQLINNIAKPGKREFILGLVGRSDTPSPLPPGEEMRTLFNDIRAACEDDDGNQGPPGAAGEDAFREWVQGAVSASFGMLPPYDAPASRQMASVQLGIGATGLDVDMAVMAKLDNPWVGALIGITAGAALVAGIDILMGAAFEEVVAGELSWGF